MTGTTTATLDDEISVSSEEAISTPTFLNKKPPPRHGPEGNAACLQLRREFLVIVNFAVVDQDEFMLFERLIGRIGQVDNRQPPMTELHPDTAMLAGVDALRIGAAMGDRAKHVRQEMRYPGQIV